MVRVTKRVPGSVPRGVRVAAVARDGVLRRNDEAVAVAFEELAENALALTPAVIDRCIDDVARRRRTGRACGGTLVWRRAAPSLAKPHRPEEQFGHPQPGLAFVSLSVDQRCGDGDQPRRNVRTPEATISAISSSGRTAPR